MKSMYMNRKKIVSSLLSMVVIAQLVFPVPASALFGKGPKIPSANQVAQDLERRYNINKEEVQNAGQNFNVSDNKKTAPEVTLFFSPTDPKEGEKIIAKAFPTLFSNPSDQLYYTWYLKRKDCDLGSASGKPAYCNADGSGGITVNDWKVSAARILATDGADKAGFNYATDTDADGYKAEFGGSTQTNTKDDWCYVLDRNDGEMYELTASSSSETFACGAGYTPACVSGTDTVDAGTINSTFDPLLPTSDPTFTTSTEYEVVGRPSCNGSTASCGGNTTSRCVNLAIANSKFNQAQYDTLTYGLSSCTAGSTSQKCVHLFPRTSGSGSQFGGSDGIFDGSDEFFWGTNSNDPDTADNGNKDEANVIGLGQESFSWNYQAGDQIGVVVEGTSIIPTKHADSSNAIMWAFTKNDCKVINKGSYNSTIRGYSVNILTTTMSEADFNACFEDNLVDPLQGGQGKSKKLDVTVSATPENPTNDQTAEKTGDAVSATASVTNSSRPPAELSYAWKILLSNNAVNGFKDITAALVKGGMLASSSGNGLDSITIALNMDSSFLGPFGLSGVDPLYMKMEPTIKENFSSGVERVGKSDVVVRISNTTKKIVAYSTTAALNAVTGKYRVSAGSPICNVFYPNPTTVSQTMENLNKAACRVVNDEIVGVEVSPAGLSDFSWTLNGVPLACTSDVSPDAACAAGNRAFFAVAGEKGETYTLQVKATSTLTGKSVTLARTFQVVEPELMLEVTDPTVIWPKFIGDYTALDGNVFEDYSSTVFEKYGADPIKLKVVFLPSFVSSLSTRTWTVDGENVPESAPFEIDYTPAAPKTVGDVYNTSVSATLLQNNDKRFALRDIWGIDALSSSETVIAKPVQVAVVDTETLATSTPRKFFAAVSSYLPASVLFSFKLMATMATLLFTVGFIFSLVPEAAPTAPRRRGNRME